MICAWKELLAILPIWMRAETDKYGAESVTEIRLRCNAPPELRQNRGSIWLQRQVTADDLNFVINTASRYSPWTSTTIAKGYLTAPGGHRIGVCGTGVIDQGKLLGIRDISSICIRVSRDFPGIAKMEPTLSESVLILGAPGWGKTTLLRDMIRKISNVSYVCVVDERGELFPEGFQKGAKMDVLTGIPKPYGIDMALRTMGPEVIAVDEITEQDDCNALLTVSNCGVRLLATAHASSLSDYRKRKQYHPLAASEIFDTIYVLHSDRTFHVERGCLCR